jgi:hypothetical protein
VTIQDLGSIAELIAAFATVATLAYLAVQIRNNTRATQAESRRSEIQTSATIVHSLVADREVARMYNAGLADFSSLSPEDQMRFSMLLGHLIGAEGAIFDEVRLGVVSEETLDRRTPNLRGSLDTPRGREFWKRFSDRYPKDFREFVEREILGSGSEPAAQQGAAADEPQRVPIDFG